MQSSKLYMYIINNLVNIAGNAHFRDQKPTSCILIYYLYNFFVCKLSPIGDPGEKPMRVVNGDWNLAVSLQEQITRSLFNNYRLCCVMENTEIWLADTRNKVTFMFA